MTEATLGATKAVEEKKAYETSATDTTTTSSNTGSAEEDLLADLALALLTRPHHASVPGAHAVGGLDTQDAMEEAPDLLERPASRTRAATETEPTVVSSSGQRGQLVEARPVPDDEEANLPQAREAPKGRIRSSTAETESSQQTQKHSMALSVTSFLVLVAVIVITVVVVVVVKKDDSGNATDISSEGSNEANNLSIVEVPQELFPDYTWNAIEEQSLPLTSQAKAYDWLTQDPLLANYTNDQLRQRFALATFYYATTNDNASWTQDEHFLSYDKHECDWYFHDESYSLLDQGLLHTTGMPNGAGGPCERKPNHSLDHVPYIRLWFARNGLVGTLPEELYWLTSLESIDVSLQHSVKTIEEAWTEGQLHHDGVALFGGPDNTVAAATDPKTRLHGTLSTRIGQLTNLRELKISGNHFSGALPSELGLLSSSMELRATGNFFTSSIPSEIYGLSNLLTLFLGLNHFTGSLLPEVAQLQSMNFLMITGTRITGTIPSELGLLVRLICSRR